MIAAVVPAAGRSERMGRPKLVLPVGGESVIARVVAALRGGGAEPVVVVVPPPGQPAAEAVREEAERAGAVVVVAPTPPPDMRASVVLGLERLTSGPAPLCVLLCPGDHPGLSAEIVARVAASARLAPGSISVPVADGRRGHPVALPWDLAVEVSGLPPGVGVNALLARHPERVLAVALPGPAPVADLDTPDDYRRWLREFGEPGSPVATSEGAEP